MAFKFRFLPFFLLVFGAALAQVELPQQPGVEAWLDKNCYAEGDLLTIHVRAERDGYLTVVDISPDGTASVLLPNAYVPSVHLRSGAIYDFPAPDHPFKIRVRVPTGVGAYDRERLWVIVTGSPLSVPRFVSELATKVIQRVRQELNSLPFGTWWAATVVEFGYGQCEAGFAPAAAVEREVEELNRAIAAAGAEWVAGLTPLSGLSLEELSLRCGVVNEPIGPDRSLRLPSFRGSLPSELNWRDLGGDWTTPVKDQGPCGACWIFGPVAVYEALLDIGSQDPADKPQHILSEQYVLSFIREGKGCDGGPPGKAMEFLEEEGTVTASCFPYVYSDERLDSYSIGCLPVKLFYWGGLQGDFSQEPPKPVPVEKIKQVIYTYGPVAAAMAVYEDFAHYKKGVYRHVKGKLAGYHMVLVVGWDDGERAWICKNSWGPAWGDGGWFKILWGDSSIGYMVLAGATEYTAYYIKKYGSLYEFVRKVLLSTP